LASVVGQRALTPLVPLRCRRYVFKDIFIGAISEPGIIGIGIFGFVITVQSFLQWKTATGTSACMFKMSGAISALMLLIQFLLACWIIMYVPHELYASFRRLLTSFSSLARRYNYSLEEVSAAAEGGAKVRARLYRALCPS
jgi:hypothetical protein